MLQHVARRATAKSFDSELDIIMHGKNNHFGAQARLFDAAERLDAVEQWHRDIRHDHFRLKLLCSRKQFPTIPNRANYFKLWLQQTTQAVDDDGVVIS